MGEWKAQLSLRVRQALGAELEEFAAREKRRLGNLGELFLEWALEQLKAAGSTQNLMECGIGGQALRTPDRRWMGRGIVWHKLSASIEGTTCFLSMSLNSRST